MHVNNNDTKNNNHKHLLNTYSELDTVLRALHIL